MSTPDPAEPRPDLHTDLDTGPNTDLNTGPHQDRHPVQANLSRDDAPHPETLLRALRSEGRGYKQTGRHQTGHHKIYVGAAAGVGKTYRALQELREQRELGVDTVVGLLETHGRKETAALSEGLETVPRQVIGYKGVELTEMDTAGVIARRPDLVLVDELAHTNVPGSKHPKRFYDVEEMLQAGISVISTMNVQHLESANDLVARLTGVRVRERVPDRVLLAAREVILVDVTPEVLRERLRAGKIYAPEKVDQALSNFFTLENLAVLRELALREVADAVEDPAAEAGSGHRIKERIAVAITARSESAQLIRRGARIAQRLDSELHVVYVRTRKLSRDEERLLDTYRVIAEALEGSFVQLEAPKAGPALIAFIAQNNITQVIMGTSLRNTWQAFFKGSVIDSVLRQAADVDVHIIGRKDL